MLGLAPPPPFLLSSSQICTSADADAIMCVALACGPVGRQDVVDPFAVVAMNKSRCWARRLMNKDVICNQPVDVSISAFMFEYINMTKCGNEVQDTS